MFRFFRFTYSAPQKTFPQLCTDFQSASINNDSQEIEDSGQCLINHYVGQRRYDMANVYAKYLYEKTRNVKWLNQAMVYQNLHLAYL